MYKLVYIITEESTDTVLYTVQRDSDLALRDVDYNTLVKCVNDVENISYINNELVIPDDVKRITVWMMNNTGGKLIQGLNDLETYCLKNGLRDKLESYNLGNNELDAKSIARSCNQYVRIKCPKCGYTQETKLNYYISRNKNSCVRCATENGNGAPYCIPGTNDLYTICKKESKEYILEEYDDIIDPHEISAKSDMKVQWRCKHGHVWEASPGTRLNKGTGCPKCQGSQTSRTERMLVNWFKENHIKIQERAKIDGEEFDIVLTDYNVMIEVNSDHTHSEPKIREKDAKKLEIAKRVEKDLIVLLQVCYPKLDETLHYDITFRSDKRKYIETLTMKLALKLEEYGIYMKAISRSAVSNANANNVPLERSLLGVYTDIDEYWSPDNELSPKQIFANSRRYVKLVCKKCTEEYEIRADAIKQSWDKPTRGCPYCSGKKVISGVNDLQTLEPEVAKEWHPENLRMGLHPSMVAVHSNKKVLWKCQTCGYEWETAIANRTGVNRTGCPACNKYTSR